MPDNIVFNKWLEAAIDDFLSGRTIKLILIMSNSELETAQTAARRRDTIGAIEAGGGLDEFNGSGYASGYGGAGRKTVTLTGEVDDTNDRGSMESVTGTYVWSSLGVGSRSITGVLVGVEGAVNDLSADSFPITYFQFAVARPADGNDFPVVFDATSGKFVRFQQGA